MGEQLLQPIQLYELHVLVKREAEAAGGTWKCYMY
jgi:hypothetical protein